MPGAPKTRQGAPETVHVTSPTRSVSWVSVRAVVIIPARLSACPHPVAITTRPAISVTLSANVFMACLLIQGTHLRTSRPHKAALTQWREYEGAMRAPQAAWLPIPAHPPPPPPP